MKNAAALSDKVKKKFIRDIYVNREYSWLLFNKRVLDQARDLTNPVLERCKFLAIFQSNLDEFFMVRVGSLYNENISNPQATDNKTQLTAAKQLDGICTVVKGFYDDRAACYNSLRKDVNKCGIRIMRASELTPRQSETCKEIFTSHIMPLLSLMVLDAKHPLMQFENMKNYMLYDLEKDPYEKINVARAPAYARALAEMRDVFRQFIRETNDNYYEQPVIADARWRSHKVGYENHRGPAAPEAIEPIPGGVC